MANSAQLQKRSLECLRLEVACKELADGVSNAKLRSHLVRMARFWGDLANEGLDEPNIADMAAANVLAA
jgi:hypothetical protein